MLSHLCRSCFRALRRFVDELYVELARHGPYSTRDPILLTSHGLWPFHEPASAPVSRIAVGHRMPQFDEDTVYLQIFLDGSIRQVLAHREHENSFWTNPRDKHAKA
jgi:hypothetical protein